MGAARMRVQTADKKHHNNPHHSSPSVNVLWSNKMHVYKSPLFIILLSPVKKQSYLYEERYMHRSNTIYQQNEDNRDGRFHWRKCWYGLWTRILAAFHFTRCQLMNWSGVDYCDVFISCLDSHSNGTHSLQRFVMWSNAIFLQICSHEETNSSDLG